MVKIFIVYGGSEGEGYGTKLNDYFKRNGIASFLASRNSPDMKLGCKYQPQIDDNLLNADIAIVIITTEMSNSPAAMDEIKQIREVLHIPFIPYERKNCHIPTELSDLQTITFDPAEWNDLQLKELELKMWRTLDLSRTSPRLTNELTDSIKSIEVPYIG